MLSSFQMRYEQNDGHLLFFLDRRHMKQIRLDSTFSTLVIDLSGNGIPQISYWGSRLSDNTVLANLTVRKTTPVYQAGLEKPYGLNMLPEEGSGFRGRPALTGHRHGKNWATHFTLKDTSSTPHSAEIHLEDNISKLSLILDCKLDPDTGVVQRRSRLINNGKDPYSLTTCASAAIPIPPFCSELMTFHGSWTGEFVIERTSFSSGITLFENRTGRTSHEVFPAMIACTKGCNENDGIAYGVHLGWSGNAQLFAECVADGNRQIQMGELLLPGEIILQEKDSYTSPWIYSGYSTTGLNGLSHAFHDFLRNTILPKQASRPRPTQFNSWEAVYFDHDLDKLKLLASEAANLGIERFVLDDGWFHKRHDDNRALGDWWPDEEKYPNGLAPLIDHVKAEGMDFGLWVEPEMINPESELYRNHPEWILHLEGFPQQTGRNQFVLNLCMEDVCHYLFEQLHNLLKNNDIDYLKWDMNRILTTPGNNGNPAIHNQTHALYTLLDRLRKLHPNVEIESCASGGGRVDFEILKRTERFWASDSNDPFERQRIQKGASIFFPPEITGSHIGPATCHTSGRATSLEFRAMTALFSHFGCEFNLFNLSTEENKTLRAYIKLHKHYRHLLHHGDAVRLELDARLRNGYGSVARDKSAALFCVMQLEAPGQIADQTIRFSHLDPDGIYLLKLLQPVTPSIDSMLTDRQHWLDGFSLPGKVLMESGISIYMPWPGTGILIDLQLQQAL